MQIQPSDILEHSLEKANLVCEFRDSKGEGFFFVVEEDIEDSPTETEIELVNVWKINKDKKLEQAKVVNLNKQQVRFINTSYKTLNKKGEAYTTFKPMSFFAKKDKIPDILNKEVTIMEENTNKEEQILTEDLDSEESSSSVKEAEKDINPSKQEDSKSEEKSEKPKSDKSEKEKQQKKNQQGGLKAQNTQNAKVNAAKPRCRVIKTQPNSNNTENVSANKTAKKTSVQNNEQVAKKAVAVA